MNCDCLIHPFQNDPGTSQSQRVMDDLLTGAAKIDARSMADLLDYFVQMSRHINFYDLGMNVNDWQPFFKKSIPFVLASIIKFPLENTENNLELYRSIFMNKPSPAGLQLISFSLFHRFINNINNWHLQINDSSLPIAGNFDNLVRSKLQTPVKQLIIYSNTAAKHYGIRKIDFLKISENPVWGLDQESISATDKDFQTSSTGAHQRMIDLYTEIYTLLTVFTNAIKSLSSAAEINLDLSFVPLKEEFQKKHPPHLALIFAFLKIFRQLQSNLNEYSRKHLDYFYKEILQFRAEGAVPDRANILFEIQDALKSYLLKKGLKVKDGKDDNRQDILFALEDDIVVNQTKIEDKRTLFLNNQTVRAQTYVEGVYMAPVAGMADGVEKEFSDDPKNFPTLGSKYSKFADPETGLMKPYPNARIGFVLASPVLLLQSGSVRNIIIDIPCVLKESVCSDIKIFPGENSKDCCNETGNGVTTSDIVPYPGFYAADKLYNEVNAILSGTYYYISEDLLKAAVKKGVSVKLADQLRDSFLTEDEETLCYCPVKRRKLETVASKSTFDGIISDLKTALLITSGEEQILREVIKGRHALNLLLSGHEGWIEPSLVNKLEIIPGTIAGPEFILHIELRLDPEVGDVTFYNKEVLIEDLGTTLPLIKAELDDKIKFTGIILEKSEEQNENRDDCCRQNPDCCLLRDEKEGDISLYHFFRNVTVNKVDPAANTSIIKVEVCGLKKFIVQNDESVMDVNGPVYPFGARPDIINFDMENPPAPADPPLIGPSFYIGSEEVFFKKWKHVRVNLKWKDKPDDFNAYYAAYIKDGLNDTDFELMASVLVNGKWKQIGDIETLFADSIFWTTPPPGSPIVPECDQSFIPDQKYLVFSNKAGINSFIKDQHLNKKLEADTLNGFIRLNLVNQDFLHKNYSFVLARQMMALGRLPRELLTNAVYKDNSNNTVFVFSDAFQIMGDLQTHVQETKTSADATELKTQNNIVNADVGNVNPAHPEALDTKNKAKSASDDITNLTTVNSLFPFFQVANRDKLEALIPNEPWTPVISNLSLDYSAEATIEDIDLIHLYPYKGTYKAEELNLQPALLPTHCDEGTLFLGLSRLVPGNNLNILFQMAEATSDSESDKETVFWHYLDSNIWKALRPGFEVLDDATNNLTGTGIVKFALPANMTLENTVMPPGLHWIKASIPKNSRAVCETTGIHAHAIQVVFTNDEANNKLRLSNPLKSGSISKLEIADASVKSVIQPYESFGGLVPEIEQQFYVRVSETLRHKGRAIQAFDYERLVLQAFPQLFKVKCINHSLALNAHEYRNDFPYAGGYVLMVVIPDLNKLKAGNSYEPKAPVSLLEDINDFIRQRTSPFVRFRAMNPRYEKVDICLKIRLLKGKDENYHRELVREDINRFLAPWAVGDYYKLTFGQCVYRSDLIQFLETREYIDFIGDLSMALQGDTPGQLPRVCPDTPRSILIAGNIEVCIIPPECEDWGNYYACDEKNPVRPCDTKPEPITDYCKKGKIIIT